MPNPIVLKDALGADVTFNYMKTATNGMLTYSTSGSLLDRKILTLQIVEGPKVNRVRYKITVPRVCEGTDNCSVTQVSYTEISSGDFSVFRAGQSATREDLVALNASLASNATLKSLVVEAFRPS